MSQRKVYYAVILSVLFSIAAITLGYAILTNSLVITPTAAVAAPPWGVVFSKSGSSATTGSVTPTKSPSSNGPSGNSITIGTDSTTFQTVTVGFTGPNQSVKYSMYAYNKSDLVAYLNKVSIGSITCAPDTSSGKNPASSSYVSTACAGISVSVKAGSTTFTRTTASNGSNTNISSHTVAAKTGEVLEFTIALASDIYIDGDMKVTIGNTTLQYDSVD